MSGWRPALRIARRTVLRSPGRTLLVALLVAVPVAGATALDVLVRTMSSPKRDVERQIGAADAIVAGISARRLAALAPAGTRVVPTPLSYSVFLERGGRATRTQLITADVREPLHRHVARLVEGIAPRRNDEVLVTRALADRLHLLDGGGRLRVPATITLRRGPTATVTGIAREPFCLDCPDIIAGPGATLTAAARQRAEGQATAYVPGFVAGDEPVPTRPLLVDLPARTSALELATLVRGAAVQVVGRERAADPDVPSSSTNGGDALRTAALVTVLVGLGLLEIVLLAGTAFAVGARRQLRELGLVAASGGSPRDVRRVVLAQGLVLGALGALCGVVAGITAAVAARPLWERMYNEELTGWTFRWEIAGIALLGVLSGLAAALVPAVSSGRMRPIHALAGRFREGRPQRRRNALVGGGLLAAGVLLGLVGDHVLTAQLARLDATAATAFGNSGADRGTGLIVAGATAAVVGLVLLAPALIGGLARCGGRLALSARLAVRDAERQRHRTGPATGAITIAVAGAVLIAFLVAMVHRANERSVVSAPPDVIAIRSAHAKMPAASLLAAADTAAAELPGARRTAVRQAAGGRATPHLVPTSGTCEALEERDFVCTAAPGSMRPAVVDPAAPSAAAAAGGELDRAARAALVAGKIVVFDRSLLDRGGRVLVRSGPRGQRLPGHLMRRDRPYSALPAGLVSPSLAAAHGWSTAIGQVLVAFNSDASSDAVDSALAISMDERLMVNLAPRDIERDTILLIIGLIAGLVTLFGVAISVALSAAEGRADLATLAAVGAPPRRRRALVGCQALLIGGLGGLLGVGLGTFVAYTARAATDSPDFVVPWGNLVAAGFGAPLLAAIVAALCTRGRLPLVRRAE